MSRKQQIKVGSRHYDWQISANVEVVEVNSNHLYPKCKVESSGAIYYARTDVLEEPREN